MYKYIYIYIYIYLCVYACEHTHMHKRAWGLIRFIWGSCHISLFMTWKRRKSYAAQQSDIILGARCDGKSHRKFAKRVFGAGNLYLNFFFFLFCLRPGAKLCLTFKSENLPFKNKRIRRLLMFLSATRNGGNECETTLDLYSLRSRFRPGTPSVWTAVKILLYQPYVSVRNLQGKVLCQCCSQYIWFPFSFYYVE